MLTVRPAEPEAVEYPEIPEPEETESTEPTSASTQDAEAPMPDAGAVQKILNDFVADKKKTVGNVSVLVVDGSTGEVLGSIAPDAPRVPGSNMKMPTAFAALEILSPETTFETSMKLDGNTLYLVGGGDVLLAPPGKSQVSAYGKASIEELANDTADALTSAGVASVDLKVDSTLFSGPIRHAGVKDVNRQYVMEARPVGTKEQDNTELFGNNPDLRVAELMAPILVQRGIKINSVSRTDTPAPESAKQIAVAHSATLHCLVDYMLTRSDNSTAESLAHLIAIKQGKPATFEGGAEAMKDFYREKGFNLDGVVFADGSGLSEDNRVTARFLVEILDAVRANHGAPTAGFASGLPVGGFNGTVHNRFRDNDMGGRIHAKTGSLADVRSLAGYLQTKKGRLLEFAVLVDGIPEKVKEEGTGKEIPAPDPRVAMDEALTKIAAL